MPRQNTESHRRLRGLLDEEANVHAAIQSEYDPERLLRLLQKQSTLLDAIESHLEHTWKLKLNANKIQSP